MWARALDTFYGPSFGVRSRKNLAESMADLLERPPGEQAFHQAHLAFRQTQGLADVHASLRRIEGLFGGLDFSVLATLKHLAPMRRALDDIADAQSEVLDGLEDQGDDDDDDVRDDDLPPDADEDVIHDDMPDDDDDEPVPLDSPAAVAPPEVVEVMEPEIVEALRAEAAAAPACHRRDIGGGRVNRALAEAPDALHVNLTVPTTQVRLGPLSFDGLQAFLSVPLADVLSPQMRAPRPQRPGEVGAVLDVYPARGPGRREAVDPREAAREHRLPGVAGPSRAHRAGGGRRGVAPRAGRGDRRPPARWTERRRGHRRGRLRRGVRGAATAGGGEGGAAGQVGMSSA